MSLSGSATAKPLALTEELEKLEQSITLTLQEIDHNFSRAHRIVTSSILPIVEQYAQHSNAVWEGSKFWKQFFEASANVSLSGVEEKEEGEEDETYTASQDNASTYETTETTGEDETLHADGEHHYDHDQTTDSLLDNVDVSGSTPRRPRPKSGANFAGYPSPYETLKNEIKGRAGGNEDDEEDESNMPTTPGPQSRLPDMSMSPHPSSPFEPGLPSTQKRTTGAEHQALLHRVLDKNYRVQATPHKTPKARANKPSGKASWRDLDSPMSSPAVAAPQLRAEIFSSPVRLAYNQGETQIVPRTPGISVQTPAKGKGKLDGLRSATKKKDKDEITWESDSDEDPEGVYRELGMSPPKTIQFSMPQSRLMQTPAREASKQIVQDLLATAGVDFDDTGADESPSMVAMKHDLEDSF